MPTLQPSSITDALFGTRSHTEGAQYQKPRKIPLRIEPKTYFANERTFLAWLGMATTLGTVSTAIAGFAIEDGKERKGGISQGTVELITLTLLPLSVAMIAYALFTFYWRSEFIRRKQVGFFDDKVGPITLAIVVMISLTAIMIAAIKDLIFNHKAPGQRAAAMPGGYIYLQLAEAVERIGAAVNIWAVVAESSVPRATRGTDMVVNLTLVDPSTDDLALPAGIELLCFAASADELPTVHRPGDIIRLHRVKINRFQEKPQLLGKVGFRGGGFSFCLFDGQTPLPAAVPAPPGALAQPPRVPLAPYQHSSQHYHSDELEERVLGGLLRYQHTLSAAQLRGNTTYLRRLRDVRPKEFFDATARVLAVDGSDPQLRLLHIWDGSDAIPFPTECDTREEELEGMRGPERQQAQSFFSQLRPFALPLEDMPAEQLRSLPLLGTALPVVFPKEGVAPPPVGAWVKFRNLAARVVTGQLQAQFHRNSRWSLWQDEAGQGELAEEYTLRLADNQVSAWAPNPRDAPGELLALSRPVGHPDRAYSTLRQLLLDTSAGVPRKYRVLARLVDYVPQHPAQMCHPAVAAGLPDALPGQWLYTLKLLLEDGTAQLDAILFGPDGDTFLEGLPARDLAANAAAAQEVQLRLARLKGLDCQRMGGPWMELTLKAYFTDPAHPWQTRQYRIIDTALTPAAAGAVNGVEAAQQQPVQQQAEQQQQQAEQQQQQAERQQQQPDEGAG